MPEILHDKKISAQCVSFCSTMDLVAIVTKDNQLNTYRVYYWQLLSKIKTTQAVKITAVSWSPDGTVPYFDCTALNLTGHRCSSSSWV